MKTSFDKELPNLVWFTIVLALCVVGGVLLLALPVHRALISVLNIFLVVFAIIGFMGYAGVTYAALSFSPPLANSRGMLPSPPDHPERHVSQV